MHPQLLFRLLLGVLLGVSTAFVLPNRNFNPRNTPELTSIGSRNDASPVCMTMYLPDQTNSHVRTARTAPSAVESSGQASPDSINKRGEAHGTHFQQSAPEAEIARDNTEEPGSIYGRDGGGSNMTIIYIIVPILAVGFLIGACICWRKFQGH